jgi:hypothetical protein
LERGIDLECLEFGEDVLGPSFLRRGASGRIVSPFAGRLLATRERLLLGGLIHRHQPSCLEKARSRFSLRREDRCDARPDLLGEAEDEPITSWSFCSVFMR